MKCPYCDFVFKKLAVNGANIPPVAPIVCESCAEVGLLENGVARKLLASELLALRQSRAWSDFIAPALEVINRERRKRS